MQLHAGRRFSKVTSVISGGCCLAATGIYLGAKWAGDGNHFDLVMAVIIGTSFFLAVGPPGMVQRAEAERQERERAEKEKRAEAALLRYSPTIYPIPVYPLGQPHRSAIPLKPPTADWRGDDQTEPMDQRAPASHRLASPPFGPEAGREDSGSWPQWQAT